MKSSVIAQTVGLLVLSNVFMTFAWYAHLKNLADRPWYVAALVSWGIALFEYLLQVPANRIGYTAVSAYHLKTIQEIVTLCVFAVFSWTYLNEPIRWNHAAAFACLAGAAFFMFL